MQIEIDRFKSEWDEKGFFIVPQLFDAELVTQTRKICDDIFKQWLAESSNRQRAANNTNMAFMTESRYFKNNPESRRLFLETIANEKILNIFKSIFNAEPLFHNTQYFFEPANETRAGNWHRDQQFISSNDEKEKATMSQIGLHVHIALVPDDNLEIVSGTHIRYDNGEEYEIRKGLYGKKPNDEIPWATRVSLNAGDACFFSAWCLHRGNYIAGKIRRTFDVIYGVKPSAYTPPPMGFLENGFIDNLNPIARSFFERFINAYKEKWKRGEYEK